MIFCCNHLASISIPPFLYIIKTRKQFILLHYTIILTHGVQFQPASHLMDYRTTCYLSDTLWEWSFTLVIRCTARKTNIFWQPLCSFLPVSWGTSSKRLSSLWLLCVPRLLNKMSTDLSRHPRIADNVLFKYFQEINTPIVVFPKLHTGIDAKRQPLSHNNRRIMGFLCAHTTGMYGAADGKLGILNSIKIVRWHT